MKREILGIIPARGGSKSVPRKNIKLLHGKPLIAWTIEEAKKSKYLTRIIVSTDDKEIAGVSKKYDAEVPFLRPKEISGDLAKDIELPEPEASFKLEEKYFVSIMRAASVMSLPEIAVIAKDGKIKLQAIDSKTSVDSYAVDLGNSDSNFKMIFKLENLKLMKGTYDVKISNKGLGHFKNTEKKLEYWIATEQTI